MRILLIHRQKLLQFTKMRLLDLGAPGNSLGDVYHFSTPLHSERGGPVTGELNRFKDAREDAD